MKRLLKRLKSYMIVKTLMMNNEGILWQMQKNSPPEHGEHRQVKL